MTLSRRALLITSAALAVTPPALAASPAPPRLGAIARALFPIAFVPDARYTALSEAWAAALSPPDRAALPAAAAPVDPADPASIAAALRLPLWQGFRAAILIGLYADLSVTRRFGYQGPSLTEGGYIHRGFDDIAWLPKPPPSAPEPWLD